VEQSRDVPLEFVIGLREEVAGLRTAVSDLRAGFADFRQEVRADIRRLDDRLFQLMLLQLGTLATALAALVAAVVS
jgi:hypothetical protein